MDQTETTSADSEVRRPCERCGSPLTEAAHFCTTCGQAALSDTSGNATAEVAPHASRQNLNLVVLAGAVLAVIAAVIVVLVARGDGEQAARQFPASVQVNFLNSCRSTGGTPSYCQCALDEVEAEYDLANFLAEEEVYLDTGILPSRLRSVIEWCAGRS